MAATFGAWLYIFFFGTGSLVQNGFGSLRYFTLLSNLFAGIVAAAWLVTVHRDSKTGADPGGVAGKEDSGAAGRETGSVAGREIERLKYISAASVGLTLVTVLGFLGPIYGYIAMFEGANLFLHLLAPVAAIAEVIFLSDAAFTRKDNMLVIIPPFLYGLGYVANILVNGIGEWPDTNDWYFFFAWGYAVGAVIYLVLLAVTWLLGLLMRILSKRVRGAETEKV